MLGTHFKSTNVSFIMRINVEIANTSTCIYVEHFFQVPRLFLYASFTVLFHNANLKTGLTKMCIEASDGPLAKMHFLRH